MVFIASSSLEFSRFNKIAPMAVEARQQLSFFPPHLLTNREMNGGLNEGNPTAIYNSGSIGYVAPPLSGTSNETLYPIYNSVIADSLPVNAAAAAVSSRKRSRDSMNPLVSFGCDSFSFLGEDMSIRMQYQQMEIEQFISQHTERLKMEIEDRRKRHARIILGLIEQGMMKKIRARDEQIENIGKLNWALEEKVKSLYMENQIWRDLAETNEATVNTLRSNLEQVLTQRENLQAVPSAEAEDEESCCGSNDGGEEEIEGPRRTAAAERICRSCCTEEASVLLLPCRHLCLCSVCGSSVHTCPICKAPKTASVHINLSP